MFRSKDFRTRHETHPRTVYNFPALYSTRTLFPKHRLIFSLWGACRVVSASCHWTIRGYLWQLECVFSKLSSSLQNQMESISNKKRKLGEAKWNNKTGADLNNPAIHHLNEVLVNVRKPQNKAGSAKAFLDSCTKEFTEAQSVPPKDPGLSILWLSQCSKILAGRNVGSRQSKCILHPAGLVFHMCPRVASINSTIPPRTCITQCVWAVQRISAGLKMYLHTLAIPSLVHKNHIIFLSKGNLKFTFKCQRPVHLPRTTFSFSSLCSSGPQNLYKGGKSPQTSFSYSMRRKATKIIR